MLKLRLLLTLINLFLVVFFSVFYYHSLTSERSIKSLSNNLLEAESVRIAPTVEKVASHFLRTDFAKKVLGKQETRQLSEELIELKRNPETYVRQFSGRAQIPPCCSNVPKEQAESIQKINRWKQKIRRHFQSVIHRFVFEVQVFGFTNMIVSMLSLWLCSGIGISSISFRRLSSRAGLSLSIFLMISMGASIVMFFDNISLLSLLMDSRIGFWYPISVIVVFTALVFYQRPHKKVVMAELVD